MMNSARPIHDSLHLDAFALINAKQRQYFLFCMLFAKPRKIFFKIEPLLLLKESKVIKNFFIFLKILNRSLMIQFKHIILF
jgi:hypothetical protein